MYERKFRMCCSAGKESDQKSAELHLTVNFHFGKGKQQARQESDLPYCTVDL